jgi:signal transduction histidine kinase
MFTAGDVLQANWIILYAVYGQVFFVMGLVTWLNSRRQSRLELAKALPWLAAFGITHGLNEWGYIFVPLQAQYLPPALLNALIMGHLLLLVLSFFFLFQFGVRLLLPALGRGRWLRYAPVAAPVLWGCALAVRSLMWEESFNTLTVIGDGWSRYLLCFPGALLAHFGFIQQSRQVRAMGFGHISRYLRGAAISFSSYAIVGGLIAPVSPVFPANWLNYEWLNATLHVPAPIFRSLCGLAMVFFVTRSYDIFQVENDQIIDEMRRAQILSRDRERIGRELHDGIIQSIYAAGLSLEDAQHHVNKQPDVARQRIQTVMGILNRSISDIRRYIFDLQTAEQARELESVLEELVTNLRLDTMLDVELEVVGQRYWNLDSEQIANVIQIAREALSNIVQHASARHVMVRLQYGDDVMRLTITDDGVGIHSDVLTEANRDGHGIGNMQDRAQLMGCTLTLDTAPDQGVTITLTVSCQCDRSRERRGRPE